MTTLTDADRRRSPLAAGARSGAWRAAGDDAAWVRPALLALLAATGGPLPRGTSAPPAGPTPSTPPPSRPGTKNWKAFFFGSSDAGNSITVDKPPAALWVMALSVRLFGLSVVDASSCRRR